MKLSLLVLFVALFSCGFAQTVKCPAVTCKLALCNDLLRAATVRPDYSGNMLRGNGVDMGGSFCYPKAGSTARTLVDVKLGEASVSVQKSGDPLVPISSFAPVTPSFPANLFKAIKMPSGLERITRRSTTSSQFAKLDNLCIVLPVKSYRLKRPDGSVGGKQTGGADDCVAIRVQAKKLQYEMVWNNTDDIDFKVVEPTGVRISRRNTLSPSGGRFNTDVGVGRCSLPLFPNERSRETISWDIDQTPPSGVYTAIARLYNSCGKGPVQVCLRVALDGVVKKQRCKVISMDRGRQFFSVGFRMP